MCMGSGEVQTTVQLANVWYNCRFLWMAIPIIITSAIFTVSFIPLVRVFQRLWYPIGERRMRLTPRNFTMLGDELPDNVDVPGSGISGGGSGGRTRAKAQRPGGLDAPVKVRSRSRPRSRPRGGGEYEKRGEY